MDPQPYQTPPHWWSPLMSPKRVRCWKRLREHIRIKHNRLLEIEIQGLENLRRCIAQKQGILITPNHSCHADPSAVYWVADQLRVPFYFMAGWQVFARSSRIWPLVMRHHGCFSVDREGTDIRAFRQAVDILQHEPYPLVIFPEGAIYHINKRITPFHDGPAAMALTASRHAKRPVSCIPCGIRYQYISKPMEELLELMDRLEQQILWRPRRNLVLRKRIYQFAEAILGLKEKEYLGYTQSGTLPERIQGLTEYILHKLENKYGLSGGDACLPERVKTCRRHAILLTEDAGLSESERQAAGVDLDDLFIVTQLFSYPGTYVSKKPSIEDMAEMLDKFEEDVLRRPTATIRGTRRAVISFGTPIPVEASKAGKDRVHALTGQLEEAVQALLDEVQME